MANEKMSKQEAERELTQAEVNLEQQGEPAAEREHIAYEALGEEGGDAVKEKYIDSWRKDENTKGGNSR